MRLLIDLSSLVSPNVETLSSPTSLLILVSSDDHLLPTSPKTPHALLILQRSLQLSPRSLLVLVSLLPRHLGSRLDFWRRRRRVEVEIKDREHPSFVVRLDLLLDGLVSTDLFGFGSASGGGCDVEGRLDGVIVEDGCVSFLPGRPILRFHEDVKLVGRPRDGGREVGDGRDGEVGRVGDSVGGRRFGLSEDGS